MITETKTLHPTNSLKSFVVSDKAGKLVFPPTIPHSRKKLTNWIIGFFILLCFIGTIYLDQDLLLACEAINYVILGQYIVELVHRVILSIEELFYHFKPRYGNNLKDLLMHCFYFTFGSMAIMVISTLISLYFFMDHGFTKITNLHNFLSILVLQLLLNKLLKIEDAPIYRSLKFEEEGGLSYSSGMAHSFFHGYLRIILPKTGGEDKNLTEFIDIYSDTNNVRVFPKLFILVPKSGVCSVTLEGPNIEESSSLDEKKLTIAGVQKRVYKNSVYKIKDPKKPSQKVYVCAEYATPLRTFRLALDSSGPYSELFKAHKQDIISMFYLITRDLIRQDPEIVELCELIYYDDRDEQGNFRDVSQILLGKIKRLEKKRR